MNYVSNIIKDAFELSEILDLFDEYVEAVYPLPEPHSSNKDFKQRSYELWALEKLREHIIDNYSELSVLQIIDDLIYTWEDGIEDMYSVSDDVIFMFTTAIDTLEDVACLLI